MEIEANVIVANILADVLIHRLKRMLIVWSRMKATDHEWDYQGQVGHGA